MATVTATRNTQDWRTVRFEVLERIESLPSLSNVITEFLKLARKEANRQRGEWRRSVRVLVDLAQREVASASPLRP